MLPRALAPNKVRRFWWWVLRARRCFPASKDTTGICFSAVSPLPGSICSVLGPAARHTWQIASTFLRGLGVLPWVLVLQLSANLQSCGAHICFCLLCLVERDVVQPFGSRMQAGNISISICFVNPLCNPADNAEIWLGVYWGEETTALKRAVAGFMG